MTDKSADQRPDVSNSAPAGLSFVGRPKCRSHGGPLAQRMDRRARTGYDRLRVDVRVVG
jgi:hypothetical protein